MEVTLLFQAKKVVLALHRTPIKKDIFESKKSVIDFEKSPVQLSRGKEVPEKGEKMKLNKKSFFFKLCHSLYFASLIAKNLSNFQIFRKLQ
jgi:hypothetical protein